MNWVYVLCIGGTHIAIFLKEIESHKCSLPSIYFWRGVCNICWYLLNSRPENLKKSRPKRVVKSNKSISRKFFLTKFHILQFQKWPKINFWTKKKFKTVKNAISRILFLDLFDLTSFFAWTFFNFLDRCGNYILPTYIHMQ